jgi:hypothetical protein
VLVNSSSRLSPALDRFRPSSVPRVLAGLANGERERELDPDWLAAQIGR